MELKTELPVVYDMVQVEREARRLRAEATRHGVAVFRNWLAAKLHVGTSTQGANGAA
jgi:hypothetical protein